MAKKRNGMKVFYLITCLLFTRLAFAQDSTGQGTVFVHKDPRIDVLIKKQIEINTHYKKVTTHNMKGFRLMVINTNKRDEAIAAKTKIYTYFPELKAYLVYQSPYFKLKAGNFKTRDEAEKYQKDFQVFFPKGVFIISDVIEIKPEKDGNSE
ncbi:MAG TPA: SPOR domain-containing protein [Flavisolibacter sp.]|nr:SPOR domain-containing protein [Flavisolibacter sp.]